MKKPIICLLLPLAALLLPAPLFAQSLTDAAPAADAVSAKADTKPWLYEGSDIPVDESWTFGTLKNGLRYAVKNNDVPAKQMSIRVRIDAGSLHEKDDEQGFAHLIEHLAFRGSTHVPDGEAKRIWQRFGVTFGSDSNAQTTPTQTVYQLDLPNSDDARFEESMKILSGMIREPRISETALNAERAIVLAEQRESSGAGQDAANKLREHLYQGQRLAKRAVIGTTETLLSADATRLAAFHQRWYRPENTVVVIAGDGDPAVMASMIEKYYGDWPSEGIPAKQPDFGKPAAGETADLFIEPTMPSLVTMAWLRPWTLKDDTIVYNESILTEYLATAMVNRRLERAAREGSSFVFAGIDTNDLARSAETTQIAIQPVDGQWEAAVTDVRAIIADALATPPSQMDVDREKRDFLDVFRTQVQSYRFESAAKQADSIITAVDIRETVAAPQTVLDVFTAMDARLTPNNVHAALKRLFAADAERVFLTAPKADGAGAQVMKDRLARAFTENVVANADARLPEKTLTIDDLPALGPPGGVVASGVHPRLQIETVQFANGVRALLDPNKAENDQIRMIVRFGKGYQSFTAKGGDLLWAGPLVLGDNGVGELSRTEIDEIVKGRRISLDFSIEDNAFEFSSTTRPDDLADQLRLIAAKLEHPGWRPGPVTRAKASAKANYDSFEMSANSVLQRDLEYLIRSKDRRWKSPSPAEIDALTPEKFEEFWSPLLKQGPIEVIIFGDFDRDKAVAALSATLGAMKPREDVPPSDTQLQMAFPKDNKKPVTLTHKGPQDQVAALIAWPTGGGLEQISESRELDVLAAIFRDRLFEKFRAEQAASYSPDMANNWPENFPEGGYLMAYTQVRPQDVDKFYAFANDVAQDLIDTPISDDELQRAVEPIKQYIERASSGNTFWLQYLKGAAFDSRRFDALGRLYTDFNNVTPARLQDLAKRYFRNDKAWKLTVRPEKITAKGAGAVPAGR
ncbi:M16 family metallopeptidase [Sphingorhabdus arenilitoris]|uniref:M16 family metallopeptidase n=1 Tax=Sphingorhabdus arenilitoris TaxID=1490041 RepID=A0ABV8REM2_9SPHN